MSDAASFSIVPPRAGANWALAVPLAVVPALLFGAVVLGGAPRALAVLAVVLPLVGLGALWVSLRAGRNSRFVVSPAGLHLYGGLYGPAGRLIPAGALRAGDARAVDLYAERRLLPRTQIARSGLFGFDGGWWTLGTGECGLLYLTDRRRVAYVPTRDGYAILLSVADPAALVAALRHAADGGTGPERPHPAAGAPATGLPSRQSTAPI